MAEFALVQAAIRTSTGTQDFTVSGFGTPAAALFFVTKGITNGTQVDHAVCSMGATDGTRQFFVHGGSKDAVTTSVCRRMGNTSHSINLLDENASDLVVFDFTAWVTDGVRVTVVAPAPAAGYLVTVLLIGGSGISNVYVSTVDTPSVIDTGTTVTAPGFQPDLLFVYGKGNGVFGVGLQASHALSLGVVQRGASNPHTQYMTSIYELHGVTTTEVRGSIRSTRAMKDPVGDAAGGEIEIQDFTSTGFSAFLRNIAGVMSAGYVAIKLNGLSAKVLSFNSPTATGSANITGIGFTPQFGMLLMNAHTAYDTFASDNTAEVFGVGLATATNQYSVVSTSDDAVTTMNAECATHSHPVFLRKDGATFYDATFTSFSSDTLTMNYATADATTRKWAGLFISEPSGSTTLWAQSVM